MRLVDTAITGLSNVQASALVGVAAGLLLPPPHASWRLPTFMGTFVGMASKTVLPSPLSATLVGFDKSLTRAAANLGADPVRTFFKVQMPLILPGVISPPFSCM